MNAMQPIVTGVSRLALSALCLLFLLCLLAFATPSVQANDYLDRNCTASAILEDTNKINGYSNAMSYAAQSLSSYAFVSDWFDDSIGDRLETLTSSPFSIEQRAYVLLVCGNSETLALVAKTHLLFQAGIQSYFANFYGEVAGISNMPPNTLDIAEALAEFKEARLAVLASSLELIKEKLESEAD